MAQSSALAAGACEQRHVEVIQHRLPDDDNAFIRLRQITGAKFYRKRKDTEIVIVEVGVLPISKSAWIRGVRSGKYPAPIRFGKISLYRVREIRELLERISNENAA